MLMRMDVARHIFSHTDQKKDGYADQKDLKDGYAASGYAEVHDHNNMPDDTVMRNNHHAGAGLVPARSQCGRIDNITMHRAMRIVGGHKTRPCKALR